jgi:hypothetical protein
MPYVVCPSCDLRFYSAAAYSTRGRCESCGAEVPTAPRAGRPPEKPAVTAVNPSIWNRRTIVRSD